MPEFNSGRPNESWELKLILKNETWNFSVFLPINSHEEKSHRSNYSRLGVWREWPFSFSLHIGMSHFLTNVPVAVSVRRSLLAGRHSRQYHALLRPNISLNHTPLLSRIPRPAPMTTMSVRYFGIGIIARQLLKVRSQYLEFSPFSLSYFNILFPKIFYVEMFFKLPGAFQNQILEPKIQISEPKIQILEKVSFFLHFQYKWINQSINQSTGHSMKSFSIGPRSIDWLIDRLIAWLIDWSIDWLIDWLTASQVRYWVLGGSVAGGVALKERYENLKNQLPDIPDFTQFFPEATATELHNMWDRIKDNAEAGSGAVAGFAHDRLTRANTWLLDLEKRLGSQIREGVVEGGPDRPTGEDSDDSKKNQLFFRIYFSKSGLVKYIHDLELTFSVWFHYTTYQLIGWLSNLDVFDWWLWLIDWLIDWSIACLFDWSIDWLINWWMIFFDNFLFFSSQVFFLIFLVFLLFFRKKQFL